jgi:hypothetical protein
MTVLAIEHTSFTDTHVTVTAVVDEMRLLYRATRFEPEEWAPALCQTTVELDPENQFLLTKMASVVILMASILSGKSLT